MEAWKKKALKANRSRSGDAGDFLGLSEEERNLVEVRVALARAVRRRREAGNMTQAQLAERIGSNQSRVAKIEAAARGVSLNQMFKGLFATGGGLNDLTAKAVPKRSRRRNTAPKPLD